MNVFLYDSMNALPARSEDHILVFAGRGSLLQDCGNDMVTEILCTYRIGDTDIAFARNGDPQTVRFEQAFSWAVKYAAFQNIGSVYGVYELDRPLDNNHLRRICPDGIIDRREGTTEQSETNVAPIYVCPNCSSVLSGISPGHERPIGAA